MKTWLKILLSSVLSFLIFAAGCFAIVKYNGFELVELRFYEPRVIANVETKLNSISAEFDDFYAQTVFSLTNFTAQESTKSFFERNASDADIKTRTESLGLLQEQLPGLEVRIIQNDGKHIHFSTFKNDILKQEGSLISYKPYDEAGDVPYDSISSSNGVRLSFSTSGGTLIFSLPLKDLSAEISGTLVCYVPVEDFTKILVSKNIITINQYGMLIAPALYSDSKNSGIVFGFPTVGQSIIAEQIVSVWQNSYDKVSSLVYQEQSGETLTLITGSTSPYVLAGWICNESDFAFSNHEKALLLVSLFIILYLVIFFLFNLKHEPLAVIKRRIQKFGNSVLLKYQNKNWSEVSKELLPRRQDSFDEIKQSLGKLSVKYADDVQFYFDRCWSEIILTLGGEEAGVSAVSAKPKSDEGTKTAFATPTAKPEPEAEPLDDAEEVLEEAEPLDDAEEVLEDAEPLDDAEEVLEEAEPLDEAEEVLEEAEPLDEAEEVLEEAEPLDDVEEVLEEAEPLDDAEEVLEEAEPLDDAEEVLEEAEPLDEAEEILEEAEPLDEAEEVLEEAEPLDESVSDDGLPDASLLTKELSLDEFIENDTEELSIADAVGRVAADPMFKEEIGFDEVKPKPVFAPSEEQKVFADSFSISDIDFSALDLPNEDSYNDDSVSSPYQRKADALVSVVKTASLAPAKKTGAGLLGRAILLKKEMQEQSQKAIVEQSDGVFVIPSNLKTDSVKQNVEFKTLVDSVLKK